MKTKYIQVNILPLRWPGKMSQFPLYILILYPVYIYTVNYNRISMIVKYHWLEWYDLRSNQSDPVGFPYRLSLVTFCYDVLEFLSQLAVLLAQFVVAAAVLLDLALDVRQRVLEMRGDFLPLEIIFTTPL